MAKKKKTSNSTNNGGTSTSKDVQEDFNTPVESVYPAGLETDSTGDPIISYLLPGTNSLIRKKCSDINLGQGLFSTKKLKEGSTVAECGPNLCLTTIPDCKKSHFCCFCLKGLKSDATTNPIPTRTKTLKGVICRHPISRSFGIRLGDSAGSTFARILGFTEAFTPKTSAKEFIVGDKIVKVNGKKVRSLQDVVSELTRNPNENDANIEVERSYGMENDNDSEDGNVAASNCADYYKFQSIYKKFSSSGEPEGETIYAICGSCWRDPWVQSVHEIEAACYRQVEVLNNTQADSDDDVSLSLSEIFRFLIRWYAICEQPEFPSNTSKPLTPSEILKQTGRIAMNPYFINQSGNIPTFQRLKAPHQIVPGKFLKRAEPLGKKGLELMENFLLNNVNPLIAIIGAVDRDDPGNSRRYYQPFGYAVNRGRIFSVLGNYVNHSCDPNCRVVYYNKFNGEGSKKNKGTDGGIRVKLEVIKEKGIEEGEELTVDYLNMDREGKIFFFGEEKVKEMEAEALQKEEEKEVAALEEENEDTAEEAGETGAANDTKTNANNIAKLKAAVEELSDDDDDEGGLDEDEYDRIAARRSTLQYHYGISCNCNGCVDFKRIELRVKLAEASGDGRHTHLRVGGKHKGHVGAKKQGMRKGKTRAGAHHK